VLWIGKATGAQFALIPRDVSSGEFTKVVQRVPVRIAIDEDRRWPDLRPGLSVTVAISHSKPDRAPVATPSAIPEATARDDKEPDKP
jgi:membrane fusion protein (multidrug efflux system)